MYINFWYPALLSSELTDTPMKVRMLGLNFVLYRDEAGNAVCLSNTCIHRGGSLGSSRENAPAKVKSGCIQCPYHGWRYDASGACVAIPSMGKDAKIPARAKIDSYPVQEKYGIVFAFLGDLPEAERPPLMDVPEWGQEGWAGIPMTWMMNCNYHRSIENALDPAHNEFVHPTHGFQGERDDYSVPELIPMDEEWGTGFMTQYVSSGTPDEEYKKLRAESNNTEAGSGNHGPNCFWTRIHPSPAFWMHQYTYELPVDEKTTRVFLINMRNAGFTPEMEARLEGRNRIVASQDIDVLEEVEPIVTPEKASDELFVPADKCIARYREYLKDWEGRGWRIDMKAMRAFGPEKAITIPSPARRTQKGWVLDTVPLIGQP